MIDEGSYRCEQNLLFEDSDEELAELAALH